ncbi:hypothetical protein Bcep18194_C6755 [Burkholderia lata]|uniref:Uncharacterized protein n=1 Tax=Burkholderia lata (strain ATCC 17760 / DSM 23089 / LMG 22485 / NCIMB 9086 / R18194 / 383) TaxID=482957 RepID=Q39P14_BURL3|nr:hypothetical protein Bcep18194_C6755 [Burkholderia lata]
MSGSCDEGMPGRRAAGVVAAFRMSDLWFASTPRRTFRQSLHRPMPVAAGDARLLSQARVGDLPARTASVSNVEVLSAYSKRGASSIFGTPYMNARPTLLNGCARSMPRRLHRGARTPCPPSSSSSLARLSTRHCGFRCASIPACPGWRWRPSSS